MRQSLIVMGQSRMVMHLSLTDKPRRATCSMALRGVKKSLKNWKILKKELTSKIKRKKVKIKGYGTRFARVVSRAKTKAKT